MYCIPNGRKEQKHTFSVLNLTPDWKMDMHGVE